MDYSLLVGVHDLRRGNSEAIRDHRLQVIKVYPRMASTLDIQRILNIYLSIAAHK